MTQEEPSAHRPHILISYNEADEEFAEWTQHQLQNAGYSTVRKANILSGKNTILAMDDALRTMTHALVMLSPEYLEKNGEEWANIFRTDKTGKHSTLIPVYIQDCKAQLSKGYLGGIAAIDLTNKSAQDASTLLIKEIRRSIEGIEIEPTTPPIFPGNISKGSS